MTRTKTAVAGVALAVMIAGCAQMTPTERRVVTGGAVGTAGGAIIGAMAGNAGLGAAAGAGAGLLGGFIYDRYEQSKQ
jgi:hypothetical protein